MLTRFLLVLLILDSLLLMAAVLLQSGKGGGLAASFGGVTSSADAILGTRQAGNLLTKISWWTGGLFLALAFILTLASGNRSAPRSILDQTFTQPPPTSTTPAPQPSTNVLPIQPVAPTGAAQTPASTPTKTKSP
jgi:preprotein translocase subunit SecG